MKPTIVALTTDRENHRELRRNPIQGPPRLQNRKIFTGDINRPGAPFGGTPGKILRF